MRRPQDTAFRQQRMPAWILILTPWNIVATFCVLGLGCVGIGVPLIFAASNIEQTKTQYDGIGTHARYGDCSVRDFSESHLCTVSLKARRKMEFPVFLYYEISNMYQNHRRYAKSIDHDQMTGVEKEKSELQICEPLKFNGSLALNPCGLVANTMFDDVITVQDPGSRFALDTTGIAHSEDFGKKFEQPEQFEYKIVADNEGCDGKQQCPSLLCKSHNVRTPCFGYVCKDRQFESGRCSEGDFALYHYRQPHNFQYLHQTYPHIISPLVGVRNEHFMVWADTAALPNFRKPYAKLKALSGGDYVAKGEKIEFLVDSRYWVRKFDGSKFLVLSQKIDRATKNPFLGTMYILVAALSYGLAGFFYAINRMHPRILGDKSLLHVTHRIKAAKLRR